MNIKTRPVHYTGPSAEIWANPDAAIPTETIPAMSLAQPWASWIAMGWKTIETRTNNRFARLVGRRFAVHASRTWDDEALETAEEFLKPVQIQIHDGMAAAGLYPRGEIVAVATILCLRPCTCIQLAASALVWYEGGVGYVLGDVSALPRGIRVSGALTIFHVDLPAVWVRQLPLPVIGRHPETAETIA